jgi:PAS domain S-box-containing protein
VITEFLLLGGKQAMAAKSLKEKKVVPGHQAKSEGDLLLFVEDLKRQWMATIDALVDPLAIVGKDYKIRKANKAMAQLSGQEVKSIIGKPCHEVFANRKSPCPGCSMLEAVKKSSSMIYELGSVRNDRFYEVTSQPLFDSNGKLDGVVQIYRDRTNAKRMQEQLSQQDKLASIGLLAGGVAHEINNPLGGILIFSQMLLREMSKESPHYADVVEIEAATQRCKAIVESLLDFARQRPTSKTKANEVNTIDAIKTALRFGKVGLHGSAHVEMHEDFDSDTEHLLHGDRNKLVQLFLNLIQNAIQAMPDGGTLTMRSKVNTVKNQRLGIYEVEDTGVGIAPENLKKVFDPFFTTKDPGEGTGLGLALCYGIVQELGGTMRVESKVNVGTRFFVELPLSGLVSEAKPAS